MINSAATDLPDIQQVIRYFKGLQETICDFVTAIDHENRFVEDVWSHNNGGGGVTRVLREVAVFEKGGVNFSHVKGDHLPKSASTKRKQIAQKAFEATGVSVVLHPLNPYVPTVHMNVRFFIADPYSDSPTWWFGGGYDLTPCYGFVKDCVHWHQTAKSACDPFGNGLYEKYKAWCDEYFYLAHRQESRGIGGLFFDDLNIWPFSRTLDFVKSVANSFTVAYGPIVDRRKGHPYTEAERQFQCYRRGRYVEFNLVYDRGTLFGLQSGGRTESILMSMPPTVQWRYAWAPEPDTREGELTDVYLRPRDWLAERPI